MVAFGKVAEKGGFYCFILTNRRATLTLDWLGRNVNGGRGVGFITVEKLSRRKKVSVMFNANPFCGLAHEMKCHVREGRDGTASARHGRRDRERG